MYLWRRQASPQWWAQHEELIEALAGENLAVISRPGRKRLQLEVTSPSGDEVRVLTSRVGGQFRKLPRHWIQPYLRQKTRPIRVGKHELIIPAGAAFGTGEHATTAMCLRLLERAFAGRDGSLNRPKIGDVAEKRPCQVVDLGTGSGILALAASLLGAQRVLGVDNDPTAIATAKENARRNKIEHTHFQIADVSRWRIPQGTTLVTANLFSELLIEVVPKLRRAPQLILSGILREQEDEVVRAVKRNHFKIIETRRRGKWVALRASRSGGLQSAV